MRWREAALAESADTERVVAFGQANTGCVGDEGAVEPGGTREAEGALEEDLAGGGLEQVGSANNLGDAHGFVVGYAGELVAGHAVATPDDEVAEVDAGDEALRAEVEVEELDGFAVGHAEAPVVAGERGIGWRWMRGAAGAGVDGFVVLDLERGVCVFFGGLYGAGCCLRFMRRAESGGEVFARAAAGVDEAAGEELAHGSEVDGVALALRVGRVRAADVGAFLPVEA